MAEKKKTVKRKSEDRAVGYKRGGAPNQGIRVVRILRWLHDSNKGLTVDEIIQKLAEHEDGDPVHPRQINRDLTFIQRGGIELRTNRKDRTVRYSIPMENRLAIRNDMSASLSLAVQLLKDVIPQSAKLRVDQLMDQIPSLVATEGGSKPLASNNLMMSIQAGTWRRDVDTTTLADVFVSVAKQSPCRIRYGGLTRPEETIFPCKVTMYLGRIYLIAYKFDVEQYFIYAVDKISYYVIDKVSRGRKHEFDETKLMETRWGIWSSISNKENPSNVYKVIVDIVDDPNKPYLRREFVERIWHPSQKTKDINDTTTRMTFRCGVSPELVSWVLRWAPQIVVQEPEFLKNEVKKRAKALMKTL